MSLFILSVNGSMPVRENIRSRVHLGMKEIAICSPEIYESQVMQRYIAQKCVDADNRGTW